MTKREMFVTLATLNDVVARPELVEFINHEIELLDNRKVSSSKPTKTQKENEQILVVIKDVLTSIGTPCTVTEMITDDRLNIYTNQKISALLRKLVEKGEVVKTMDGKKAKFSLA